MTNSSGAHCIEPLAKDGPFLHRAFFVTARGTDDTSGVMDWPFR